MNNESSQPKPEESNNQIVNPNPEQKEDTSVNKENQINQTKEENQNNPKESTNSVKLKESQMVQEEEIKKEEEKKDEEKKEEEKKEEEKKDEEEKKEIENLMKDNKEKEIKPETETQIKKENEEIQEIKEVKPEIKVEENKVKFAHPMYNYSTPESIKEIETCPPNNLFNVLSKRLNDIPIKLADILKNNEKYTLICLYYKIYSNFLTNQNAGNNPKLFFQRKDVNSRLKISDFDFQDVLVNELRCQLTTEEIILILHSLKQKTETLYSYDEFIKNVMSINQKDNEFKSIYQECSFYFDDYIYSFRHFIQDNQIDYKGAFSRSCTGITELPFDLFKKFLNEINFKLANEKEIIHLFCSLCPMNYILSWNNLTFLPYFQINQNTNAYLSQKILFNIAELKDISEEDFNEKGKVINKNTKNAEWTKNIMNFTEETKKLNKKQYESYKTVFQKIHKKCVEYDISSLTKFFAESDFDIEPDGDIQIKDFRDAMMNIGVSYNVQLESLINKFKNMKKKPKEMMKLVEFLSIYNIFAEEDDNENENENEDDIEKKEKESIDIKEKEKEYVHKNAHRKFTQDDIDYIVDICKGIADIIIDELNDSITNFINKKDRNNQGYITLNDFKDIMEHDLKIDYKSDIDNLQIFFDFITSNKMIEGEDIIETKKLINILVTYSERDKPDNYKEEDNNKIINNNKILFKEEDEIQGTNAPNLNNNINNNILNSENEEIKSENKMPIEMINTQINTSTISFEKIMSEFAKYLFNNRIRFNSIFPSIKLDQIVNNQTISDETLKLGFQNASFPLNEKEFSVIMTHFDPINKSKVLVEELKHEISKYEPKYFSQSYQRINTEEIDNKLAIKSREFEKSPNFGKTKYNANLLNGMNKIKNYLERNNIPINNFFLGLFDKKKHLEDKIDEAMWKSAFFADDKKKYIDIPELKLDEVNAIFREMDSKLKNEIALGDIINFFKDYLKKGEKLIDINDESSLNEYIKKELSNLFENYKDNEKDLISLENFYICLKSINHKATKDDARNIISQQINSNKVEMIEKKVFEEIMFNQIQKELVIQKEEKNYIINLFKQADFDKNGYLKRNQIKYLIKNKIGCNLTDAELDEILDKVDIKQENEIDIIEFVYLLDNINSTQNNKLIESDMNQNQNKELIPIMNLNLNLNMHRKIRPKDFMSLYSDLPISFIPSFIREEQQKNNLLSSSCLKPLTKDDITYEDILPNETLIYSDKKEQNIYQGIVTYKKLKEVVPKINCKIYFDDYASGVSSPDESFFEKENSKFKVVGRLLKIALFDKVNNIFKGNAISIDCIYKKEYQDRWYFEDDNNKFNNNIIIRYNENDLKAIDVIFEFVLVVQKKIEQNIYTVEVSCGWCGIPLENLQISRKEKLKIYGGSPLKAAKISETDIRKKRTGFIPKLATLFEGPILSECPIRVKTFKDLTNDEKKYINYLPSLILCHSLAMNMISIYRQLLGEFILNHKDYLLKCIKDEYDLANMFCKIADVPDAFRVMNEIWKEIIIDGSSSAQKNDEVFIRESFKIYVQKINNILYAEKFKYNPLDPTELPRGDIKLMQDRDILLNSALRAGLDKKFNKLEYKMEDCSYKPFTMDEINGQKGNAILEKFDEIITLSNY